MPENIKKEFVVEGYIIKDNKILLLHHRKLDLWLPPGGHIEDYETPEEALIREVKEETGFDIEIVKQVKLKHDFNVSILAQPNHIQLEDIKGTHYHIDLVYVCKIKGGNLIVNDLESKDLRFFSINEIEKMSNVPKEVIYFSRKFLSEEINRNECKLPVLKDMLLSNKTDFSNISLLMVQHIKKNTIEFIKLLKDAGFKSITVIAKSYSLDKKALEEIEKYCKVATPSFEELESLKPIEEVVEIALHRQDKFICLDMGGYFSKYFHAMNNIPDNLMGIVEDTKNGIWFDDSTKLKFPLLSIASSELKDYTENYFVAKAIVRNSENILINSEFKETLAGKKILVLGYGKIGKNIAKIIKSESEVAIYDISPKQLLKAKIDGFNIIRNLDRLYDFDMIIGITGNMILKEEELINLKNGAVLVNGSTRKKEFDIDSIRKFIMSEEKHETYTVYTLHGMKQICLVADGYPVNFLGTESIPEPILDMIFSEMFALIKLLAERRVEHGFYPIEIFYKGIEEEIAEVWINHWK